MAYTPIANSQVDPDSPVTADLMSALRDNPIAMFAGDSGAPRLDRPAMGTWWYQAGGIGNLVFASAPAATTPDLINYGDTIAGSLLRPSAATSEPGGSSSATGLSGSWRCLGYILGTSRRTLFIRIS